jgi:hypothetical protein
MSTRTPLVQIGGDIKELPAGDTLPLAAIPTGVGSSAIVFGSVSSTNTYLCFNGAGAATSSDISFASGLNGGTFVVPRSGTLGNLSVQIATSGTAVNITCTIRKNGSDTAVTATLTNTTGFGSDATHTVAVSAGDLVTVHYVVNSGSYFGSLSMSATFS